MKVVLFLIFSCYLDLANCYGQVHYAFKYKYESSKADVSASSVDDSNMKTQATNILTSNMYIRGKTFVNGTLLTLYLDKKSANSNVMDVGGKSMHINVEANSDVDLNKFFSRETVVDIAGGDTSCSFVDSSIYFYKTGKKKVYNKWNCLEYKSNSIDYKHISIWVSHDIPAVVAPGCFAGIEDGVVEINNSNKFVKVVLIGYEKSNSKEHFSVKCNNKLRQRYRFIDAFK